MATKITRDVLESRLHCKYKAHLKLAGEQGTRSEYEALLGASRDAVRLKAIEKILAKHAECEVSGISPLTADTLRAGPSFILGATLEEADLALVFDGLQKVGGASNLGDFHYVPVLFDEGRQVSKDQRLLLEVYGAILARIQGGAPVYGIVWHGAECKATKVRLSPDQRRTEQLLRELKEAAAPGAPPRLILNDHCQVCEFRQRCQAQAVQEDNLSLLRGMGEQEIKKYARKGIFTLTQLSHTFRPRRKGKKQAQRQERHYHALQALAVRDKKVYVFGTPELPDAHVRVYLDLEGNPDEGYVYLIGMIVVEAGAETRYSFWADSKAQEQDIFEQFLAEISRYEDMRVFCYGSYERAFLKRMRKAARRKKPVDRVLDALVNTLTLVYAHVYFPCYSNGLKEVGGCLGCALSQADASGLQSIVWRKRWEETKEEEWKQKLMTYNQEDCAALKRVTEFLDTVGSKHDGGQTATSEKNVDTPPFSQVEGIDDLANYCKWGRVKFAHEDLNHINKCAYFDYQRQKVYIRTNKRLKLLQRKSIGNKKKRKLRVNRRVEVTCSACPNCKSKHIEKCGEAKHTRIAVGLSIRPTGISRQVVEHRAAKYSCLDCETSFLPRNYKRRVKHLHSLKSWAIYHHVAHNTSFRTIQATLADCFGLDLDYMDVHRFKTLMAVYYRPTYKALLKRIIGGHLIHADETEVHLKLSKGYVWVFTNMEEVVFMYKPSREGAFLHDLLKGFSGVLVSDFYGVYDSLTCAQQKCLVHLIRDLNGDLLSNPFDEELQGLVGDFGRVLRTIIGTVDQHGLVRQHLHKHVQDVERFFTAMNGRTYHSASAEACKARLIKDKNKLFTFLDYDGVPWNNNNAEHAVKRFAHFRALTDGHMNEQGLNDYLVLLSIRETCRYKGVDFLQYLLSKDRDIDHFSATGRRSRRRESVEVYPKGFPFPCQKQQRAKDSNRDSPG